MIALLFDIAPTLAALERVMAAVDRKTHSPILGHVLIQPDHLGLVSLRTSNMDMEAVETFACRQVAGDAITVPAGVLHDILRNLPSGGEARLTWEDEGRAKLVCGRSRFQLPVIPADGFPAATVRELTATTVVDAAQLGKDIARIMWAAERTLLSARPEMGAVGMRAKDGVLRVAALRTNALAACDRPIVVDDFDIPLPLRLAQEAAKFLSQARGETSLDVFDGRVQFRDQGGAISGQLVSYPFLSDGAASFISAERADRIRVGREALIASVRRARAGLADSSTGVRLEAKGGLLSVLGKGEAGEGADEIECEGSCEWVGVHAGTFLDALGTLEGEVVTLDSEGVKSVRMQGEDAGVVVCIGTCRVL